MTVLMIAPGFPAEMPYFTRGLASVGASVIGLADQPLPMLDPMTQEILSDHWQVRSLWEEDAVVAEVLERARTTPIHIVECLWEPAMILAAKIREALGIPGMGIRQKTAFRDKEIMKQILDEAGIRTPKHASTRSAAGVRKAAERIGYPIIVKPISGAGSKSTYRVNDDEELERTIPLLGHIEEVSVEEFIEGDDMTVDTICVDGEVVFQNVFFYRPRALPAQTIEWISPQCFSLSNHDDPLIQSGVRMGQAVLEALDFQTGFTHMEWYRKPDGEAVFGEIAARPPGGRTVDLMNYSCDIDLFTGWAEAVVHKRFTQKIERRWNAGIIFKRAHGEGVVKAYEGLEKLMYEIGQHVVAVQLTPIGSPRRNWRQSLTGDGFVVVRHPDLQTCFELADRFSAELKIVAEEES